MASTYTVSRSTTIAAPVDRVHALINDFHEWEAWSPWENPAWNLQRTYSGSQSGVGATYAWTGEGDAGAGSMTITGSTPEAVDIALRFIKPFKSEPSIRIDLTPTEAGTEVTWRMDGPLNLMMRIFTIFKPMDAMIGPDFERGLRQLKELAESDGQTVA